MDRSDGDDSPQWLARQPRLSSGYVGDDFVCADSEVDSWNSPGRGSTESTGSIKTRGARKRRREQQDQQEQQEQQEAPASSSRPPRTRRRISSADEADEDDDHSQFLAPMPAAQVAPSPYGTPEQQQLPSPPEPPLMPIGGELPEDPISPESVDSRELFANALEMVTHQSLPRLPTGPAAVVLPQFERDQRARRNRKK